MLLCRAAEAKKQNDYVFHEKLPPMEHLEAVQGNNDGLGSHINYLHCVQVLHWLSLTYSSQLILQLLE